MFTSSRRTTISGRHYRSLWTTSTRISTSPTALTNHLLTTSPALPASPLLIYTLSKNIPTELITLIQSSLQLSSPTSVGCLSEVLPSNLNLSSTATSQELYSISTAYFHSTPTSRAIAFNSALTGRANISLGREIKQPDPAEEEVDDSGFEAFLKGKKWGFGDNAVDKKAGVIEELEGVSKNDVKEIIFFTADRAQSVLGALSEFSSASTIGLVGSSTPFHSTTNAPFTLFLNETTSSTGAVGVAIVDTTSTEASPEVKVDYSGLVLLGKPMKVTSAKGNIILTLDHQNAARLLLNVVQNLPPSHKSQQEDKEKDFFAAVFDSPPSDPIDLNKALHVSRIMAGDPSRGAMSVSTEEEVKLNYYVSFLHRPIPTLSPLLCPLPKNSFAFLGIAPSYSALKRVENTPEKGEVTAVEGFVAPSENGVVMKLGKDGRCRVCGNEGTVVRRSGN